MKTGLPTIVAVLAGALLALPGANAAELTVEVTGIGQPDGQVVVSLFNQSEGWLRKGLSSTGAAAKAATVRVTFPGLSEGDYAVSVIHDVNGNRKLDTNLVGMPIEPYGFSNDAAGNFGPPSFDQAKFRLGPDNKSITIKLG